MPGRDWVSYRAAARSGLKSIRRYWLTVFILIALCVAFWVEWSTAQRQPNENTQGATEQKPIEIPLPDAGGWTAIFTALLTGSTILLWRSTRNLWRAARDELESTERAFVFIDGFSYELTTEADLPTAAIRQAQVEYDLGLSVTRFAVAPRWKNTGSTATRNLKINVHTHGPGGDLAEEPGYPAADRPMFIAPNAVELGEFVDMPGLDALIQRGQAGAHGVVPLYLIYGKATYEDVFGREHFIKWCYRVRPERHRTERMTVSFIQYRYFNSTDEDHG